MKLVDYMKKVEKIYRDAAPSYIENANKAKAIREAIYAVWNDCTLTTDGKKKKIAELQEQERTIKADMAAIAATAKEKALEVRHSVSVLFKGFYEVSPDAIDTNALELLKSGILRDSELVKLADSYTGNITMQRIIGKYLEERPDRNLKQMGRVLQADLQDPHLKCIDSVINVGDYCLGGAPLSGSDGAERFYNRFDQMLAQTYAAAPDIDA